MPIGDDHVEEWAISLEGLENWGPEEAHWETYQSNTLSGVFSHINSSPLATVGRVGESGEELGFLRGPSGGDTEMDRYGGRFVGRGRFNRGGRDGWQYRRREDAKIELAI